MIILDSKRNIKNETLFQKMLAKFILSIFCLEKQCVLKKRINGVFDDVIVQKYMKQINCV